MNPNEARGADALDIGQAMEIVQQADPSSRVFKRCREILEQAMETLNPIPKPTPPRGRKYLTIGMATHDDYDGCYFSIQSIRLHHSEILADVEFLVVDNNPAGRAAKVLKSLENAIPNYRYVPYDSVQGSAVRDLLFREAAGEFVLCMDSHVLFSPGSLGRLIEYCRKHPSTNDLLQGPLIFDDLRLMSTHFKPKWSHGMYGVWAFDERGKDIDAEPFEIGMQGLGVFACRRDAWPGFNPALMGHGGEEGYLHEKIRRAGGRNLCLPFLRWMHRFERPNGVTYQVNWADRVRNYLLILDELGLDPQPMIDHFNGIIGTEETGRLVAAAEREFASPFRFFDGIYCINLDRQPDRRQAMQKRLEKLGIERRTRRLRAVETPFNHHIGCALSHRKILEDAKKQGLRTVLVFEDDARFTADAAGVLSRGLAELKRQDWRLFYLGGYRWGRAFERAPGCEHLLRPDHLTCTHAIAYHHSVYETILSAVPESAAGAARWVRKERAIDQFYARTLSANSFLIDPVIATQDSILEQETRVFEE
jgi:hypothetical protein